MRGIGGKLLRLVFWVFWAALSTFGVWYALGTWLVLPWWEARYGPVTEASEIDYEKIPFVYPSAYIFLPIFMLSLPFVIRGARRSWHRKWRYRVRKALHLSPPPPPVTELGIWTPSQVLALSPGWGGGTGTVWYGTVQGSSAPEGRVAQGDAGVLVIGPPRSGKTSGVIVPTVLAFDGPVVSASTKPDVLQATGAYRQTKGKLWLFDPTGTTEVPAGVTAARWSPLMSVKDWDTARDVASQMVKAEDRSQNSHSDAGDFFRGRSTDILTLALYQAHHDKTGFHAVLEVLGWTQEQWKEVREALEDRFADTGDQSDYLALGTAQRITAMAKKEYSGTIGTTANVLAAYQRTAGLKSTINPNFNPEAFVASGDTLFIVAGGSYMAEVAPIIVALVDTITRTRYRHHLHSPATARLLLALDEIANLCPLPAITSMWSEASGQGVTLLAAVQDMSQIKQRWGPDHGWLSLATQKLLLPGIADHETLKALSEMGGEYEHHRIANSQSQSFGSAMNGYPSISNSRSQSDHFTWRPNNPIDRFSQIPDGHGMIIVGATAHGLVKLTPAHSHPLWAPQLGPPQPPRRRSLAEATGSFGDLDLRDKPPVTELHEQRRSR